MLARGRGVAAADGFRSRAPIWNTRPATGGGARPPFEAPARDQMQPRDPAAPPRPRRRTARTALALLAPLLATAPSWLAALPATARGADAGADAGLRSFTISQVHQLDGPGARVRAYLDFLDGEGRPVAALEGATLTVNLGEDRAEVERLEPLARTGEGVAYVFLVDISKSLSAAKFAEIQDAIGSWIDGLAAIDRAAILAFGDDSRLIVDFTDDRAALAAGIRSLGPTDGSTLLHRALVDGLELAKRRDPGLPGRRVLVVLTDGRDEGSGLAAEDVLTKLRGDPAPVYAIGYSELRNPQERRRYLDLLHRFASNSGGAFFEADRTRFAEAYGEIRAAVRRVWLADVRCPGCRTDGNEYWLQITVETAGRILSQGIGVRLLPVTAPAPVAAPSEPEAASEPAPAVAPPVLDEPAAAPPGRRWLWGLAGLAAALALVSWAVSRRRRTAAAAAAAAAAPDEPEDEPEIVEAPASRLPPARLMTRARIRGLRFVVVRGSRPGRQYRLMLQDRAVVGSRSSCDCVLADEPNIAPTQFELTQDIGQIYIRNLSDDYPTLLDGLPIGDHQVLKSDDLIGTREVILRVVLD